MPQPCRFAIVVLLACFGLNLQNTVAMAQTSTSAKTAESATGPDERPVELDDGWATTKPSAAGFDPARLAQLTNAIETGQIHNVHAVIVERAGKLVYERYFSGHDSRWGRRIDNAKFDHGSLHDLRSVTKSVTTAVLGIALAGEHRNALKKPITTFFPDLQGKFSPGVERITLHHVLTMTAGFEWNEMEVPYTDARNDENRLDDAPDPIAMVLSRPVRHPPGRTWYYNGGLSQVIAGVIQNHTGLPLHEYTERALFEPLGISNYEWLGSSAWREDSSPSAASGLRMTARDLAKIGSVFLHGGKWNGKQVIPADWIALSSQPHVKEIKWGRSTGIYGYGFMWYPGRTNNAAGHRIVRAAGNGDQRVFVLPDLQLSITVYAGNYNDYRFHSDAKVLDGVLAARIH